MRFGAMNRPKLIVFDLDDTLCDTSAAREAGSLHVEIIKLFPGVTDLLEMIHRRGIHTVIVSTGDHDLQERKMEMLSDSGILWMRYI